MQASRFTGRRAVVVGVGSAIGSACAARLAAEGATVMAVDPDDDVAAAVATELGDTALGQRGDLTSAADAAAAAGRCAAEWGVVDVLVECGSAMEVWPEGDDTLAGLVDVVTTNVVGPVVWVDAFRELLAASPAGSVVLLGSIDGLRGNPHVPAYSIGKGGLVPLTHVLAVRLGAHGVRVNCIAAAGLVQTGSGVPPLERTTGVADLARRLTPLGRLPSPDEVAAVAAFYASDDASYVTGTVLPVDGGRIAGTPGTW